MKFIPSRLIDIITTKCESSQVTICEKDEIYCKTYSDYASKIYFKNGVKYFGSIENGILNGKGTIILPNGIKFTGIFVDNKIQGYGRLDYNEKEFYKGNFKNLKRNGEGCYENYDIGLCYKGNWENDEFFDYGVLTLKDEWEYSGNFERGDKNGLGKVVYFKTGNYFIGEFLKNKKSGKGEMMWKNERQYYKGEWWEDLLSGFGFYVYLSDLNKKKNLRNFYLGEFEKNNREGFGIHFYSDSSIYIGNWKKGLKNDKVIFFDNNGYLFLKEFENNHLKKSTLMEIEGKNDYTIPSILYIKNENLEWDYNCFEKVVKSFNPDLKKIFERLSQNEIVNKVLRGIDMRKFLDFLLKLRFYDSELNEILVEKILKISKNCFFNTKIKKEEFLRLKKKFFFFMEKKLKDFNFDFEYKENNSFMNYREFLNSFFLVFQYKFKDCENIEKKIRNFFKHRILNIFNNKLKIKEWVKNEEKILLKFSKLKKNILKIYEEIKKKKNIFLIKDFLEFLKKEKLFFFKKDLKLILRILEKSKDPLLSNYDDFRSNSNNHKLFKNKKYKNLLFSEISFKNFFENLILFIFLKEKKKNMNPFESSLKILENLNSSKIFLKKKKPKRIIRWILKKKVDEKKNFLLKKKKSILEIKKKETEILETPRNFLEIIEMKKNDFNLLKIVLSKENSKNFDDEDSFNNGYFDDL